MAKLFSSILGAPKPQPMPALAPLPPLPPLPPVPKPTAASVTQPQSGPTAAPKIDPAAELEATLQQQRKRRRGRQGLVATSQRGFLAPYRGRESGKTLLGE